MNLLKSKHWMAIGLGILSGPALATAITCTVTPPHSIITEGQTLQLQAVCNGAFSSVNWSMDGTSVTGNVTLTGHGANEPIYYTTPVGLGDSVNPFVFTLAGTPASGSDAFAGASAEVLVKPSSAVLAKAAGSATPTSPLDAACGTADGSAVNAMPTNGEQCDLAKGKPALAISGPTAFTWSCVSLTGGAEANCSAVRGYTVTANVSGGNGTVSVANPSVAAGGTTAVTATPDNLYSVATMTATGCSGTRAGNVFTTGPINATCNVTATFSNAPVDGLCGSESASLTQGGQCSVGTFAEAADTAGEFKWTCLGTSNGASDSCTAPKQYTVTAALSGTGGTVNAPTSKTVTHNGTTSFSVTPEGTNVPTSAMGDNCTAGVSGNTVNVSAVTGTCAVTVSFGEANQCGALPANTTLYTTAKPEPYVLAFDKLFDLATTSTVMQSSVTAGKTKAYEFTNDKAFVNGNVYTYYATGPTDMSISACPGDFNVPAECKSMATMGPRVYWSKDGQPYIDPQYSFMNKVTCNIGAGGPVYLNIRGGTTAVSFQTNNTVMTR